MSPTEATVDPSSPGSRLDADHPENGVLIPCRFTKNGISTAFRCSLYVNEDEGLVELIFEFSYSESGVQDDKFEITHKATVSNPIELLISVGALNSSYPICVAGGIIGNTVKELYLAYKDSKTTFVEESRPTLKTRTLAFADSIRGRVNNIKGGAIGYVAACTAVDVIIPALPLMN